MCCTANVFSLSVCSIYPCHTNYINIIHITGTQSTINEYMQFYALVRAFCEYRATLHTVERLHISIYLRTYTYCQASVCTFCTRISSIQYNIRSVTYRDIAYMRLMRKANNETSKMCVASADEQRHISLAYNST